MLRHVDLCSGIGGFSLGFEWAELSKPVLFCDIEPWSRQILAKHWPDVPIAEDVKELANDPDGLVPDCDIITAGYPCQPFSQAGQRRGSQDDRHIWPYIFSIVQDKRPTWCVFKNVYGHVTLGLDEVLSDLERESYATRPFIVPACATDAPHRRDRLWIVARNVENSTSSRRYTQSLFSSERLSWKNDFNTDEPSQRRDSGALANAQSMYSDGSGEYTQQSQRQEPQSRNSSSATDVPNTDSKLRETQHQRSVLGKQNPEGSARGHSDESLQGNRQWKPEPSVGRVANGIPRRVDRLKGLGNAIVPQIAMRIGQTIKAVEETNT